DVVAALVVAQEVRVAPADVRLRADGDVAGDGDLHVSDPRLDVDPGGAGRQAEPGQVEVERADADLVVAPQCACADGGVMAVADAVREPREEGGDDDAEDRRGEDHDPGDDGDDLQHAAGAWGRCGGGGGGRIARRRRRCGRGGAAPTL